MTEKTVKAIETIYAGTRFRSRLEAKWAYFFDAVGWAWVYEPEGYEFSDGERYLPDFWLPGLKMFVEVKPESNPDFRKAGRLCSEGGYRGLFLCGTPLEAHKRETATMILVHRRGMDQTSWGGQERERPLQHNVEKGYWGLPFQFGDVAGYDAFWLPEKDRFYVCPGSSVVNSWVTSINTILDALERIRWWDPGQPDGPPRAALWNAPKPMGALKRLAARKRAEKAEEPAPAKSRSRLAKAFGKGA